MKRAMIALAFSASALSLAMSGGAMAAGVEKDKSASTNIESKQSAKWSDNYHASRLMEMKVNDAKNDELGTISELLIDKDGKVSHVVLQEGGVLGMGENRYVIPWDRVKLSPDDQVATIDVNKDRLSAEFAAFEDLSTKDDSKYPARSDKPADDTRSEPRN